MAARSNTRTSNQPARFRSVGADFPIFPVEAGIFANFATEPPFGRENHKPNQAFAGKFP
jgi:hypothetical protein